jgi:uncharacterized membrane protein YqjE
VSNRDRKNGVPATATSIPLVDPHALPDNPSIGELVRDATTQVSTLVRAEVELAKAEITRDVKKGLTGSVFFIIALVVLLYSTFFMFFFLAELLDTWLWRWAAFLIVFILMLLVTAVFAFLGYRKVRRIRGPQQTIESVKETTAALTPGLAKFTGSPAPATATTSAPSAPAVRTTTPTRVPATASRSTAAAVTAATRPVPAEHTEYAEPVTYTEYEYAEPVEYVEYEDAEPVEYIEYESAEPVTYAEYEYAEPVTYTEYEYEYAEQIGYPTAHDPTAAVYADTGLPVHPDDDPLPRDPSGW